MNLTKSRLNKIIHKTNKQTRKKCNNTTLSIPPSYSLTKRRRKKQFNLRNTTIKNV